MNYLLLLNFIVPFVMVFVAWILKKHPVSSASIKQGLNSVKSGYSTPLSRKSYAHWDYAQSIAPDIFRDFGRRLFLLEGIWCLLSLVFSVKIERSIVFGMFLGFGIMIAAFLKTERSIRDKFEKKPPE